MSKSNNLNEVVKNDMTEISEDRCLDYFEYEPLITPYLNEQKTTKRWASFIDKEIRTFRFIFIRAKVIIIKAFTYIRSFLTLKKINEFKSILSLNNTYTERRNDNITELRINGYNSVKNILLLLYDVMFF